jgi:hypothetical protein
MMTDQNWHTSSGENHHQLLLVAGRALLQFELLSSPSEAGSYHESV